MDESCKLLLIFQKLNDSNIICIDYAFVSFDEGYYSLGAENTAKFLELMGKDWLEIESWLMRDDNYFLEQENYLTCAFTKTNIEHFCDNFWEFNMSIQKHIMYKTTFEKIKMNESIKSALLTLSNTKNNHLEKIFLNKETPKNIVLPRISETVEKIQKRIIGQNDAIKDSVNAIYYNQNLITQNLNLSEIVTLKKNIMISGPSGSGKTEIARQLSNTLNIPVDIEDIKQYSGTGWKGNEITDILKKLYLSSDKKIEVAERGIVFLDEIDKIAVTEKSHPHNTLEVQQGLLKLMEGGVYSLDGFSETISFDTKFLTVICGGAFNGYNRGISISSNNKELVKKEYINYGMMPEFMGRIKIYLALQKLSPKEQKRYLLKSELSALQLELKCLRNEGITISMKCAIEELCEKIIEKANKLSDGECGLRDLNQIATDIFKGIYYSKFDCIPFDQVTFDLDILDNPNNFTLKNTKH